MMRKIVGTIVLAVVMIAVSANARAESHLYRLLVEGLACPTCGYALEMRLKKLVGVIDVEADYRDGVITIAMVEGLPLNELAAMETVRDAGFTLVYMEHLTGVQFFIPAQPPLLN